MTIKNTFFCGIPFCYIPLRTLERAIPRHMKFRGRSTFFRITTIFLRYFYGTEFWETLFVGLTTAATIEQKQPRLLSGPSSSPFSKSPSCITFEDLARLWLLPPTMGGEGGEEIEGCRIPIRHFFSQSRRLLTKNFKSVETVNEKFRCLWIRGQGAIKRGCYARYLPFPPPS